MQWRLAVVLSLAAGCGQSTTAAFDAGSDAIAFDAGIDAGPPDASCDVTPAPSAIPMLMAGFAVHEPDGPSPPVMTGGDPTGVWVFDHGTFWVEPDATTMFNPFASSVTGTAWLAVDATEFRLDYELITTLYGTVAGTIVQSTITRVRARWRLDREQIEPTGLVCADSNQPMTGDPGRVTFTRTGDHITVLTQLSPTTGPVVMQLEGTLAR